jgi:hypothetical protein
MYEIWGNWGFGISNCKILGNLSVASYQLQVTSFQVPVASYQLPVTGYQIPVTSYRISVTGSCPADTSGSGLQGVFTNYIDHSPRHGGHALTIQKPGKLKPFPKH